MALGPPSLVASATPVSTTGITSGSFTTATDKLYIVASFNTGGTAANGQGSISSTHGTLTFDAGHVIGGGNTTGAVRFWFAKASGVASGTVTVTLASAPSIQDVAVFEMSGQDLTTPITGYASTSGTSATSGSVNVAATPNSTDYKIGLVVNRNKTTAPTVGSGYTSADSAASSTPSASYLVEYKTSDTGVTVDMANVGTTWWGLIGFIVKEAAGGPAYSYSPSLSGSGSLSTSSGTPNLIATPSLSGGGALSVVPNVQITGNASLSGSGSLGALSTIQVSESVGLSGSGILSAVQGSSDYSDTASLTGSGILTLVPTVQFVNGVSLAGSGILSALSTVQFADLPSLSGSGLLTVLTKPEIINTINLSGEGFLSALSTFNINQLVSLAGSGILTTSIPNTYTNFWYNGSAWIPISFYLKE